MYTCIAVINYFTVVIAIDKKNDPTTDTAEDPTKLETNGTGEQYSDSQPVIDSGKSM